jgi:hypothetical protein
MDAKARSQDINNILEAILDTEQLALIAYLSQAEFSLPELAEVSELSPNDIQRHLEVLEDAHLVHVIARDGKLVYQFNSKHLERVNRQQFARQKYDPIQSSSKLSNGQKKIVADYTHNDGSLKMIPTKSKKVIAILEYMADSFENDIDYSEDQINEILERYYPDPTTLRRYLIDYGYLGRERNGARYWRTDPQGLSSRNS